MKNKTTNKSANSTSAIANYTRSKDAYDGNMEITNLKSSSQKLTGIANDSAEPLPKSIEEDRVKR